MATIQPEAYLLLSVPDATLRSANGRTYTGVLNLECVTVTLEKTADNDSDVYLVIRLDDFETALDPTKPVSSTVAADGTRTYTFHDSLLPNGGTGDLVLNLPPRTSPDVETLDGILSQYVDTFYTTGDSQSEQAPSTFSQVNPTVPFDSKDQDLRGHLVLIDEDNGQMIGALDTKLNVHEDPSLQEKGRENEPVVIEVPDDEDLDALGAHEVFVRAIPPGDHNWMTKGASLVSQAITAGTSLLLTGVTRASDYYVSNTAPGSQTSSEPNTSPSSAKSTPSGSSQSIPMAMLTSERTRQGLTQVHAVSGQAVKVSNKTISMVEGLVKRVIGGRASGPSPSTSGKPALPPRTPSTYGTAPPPYTPYQSSSSSGSTLRPPASEKPALPPRRSPSPVPAAVVIPTTSEEPTEPPKLTTRDRLALSADLILSTLDDSTKKIFDVGSESMAKVAGHKYGPVAGHNTRLLMHTGRNVALVYIDMRGFGRRALVKKAGKEFVKSRVLAKKASVSKT